MTRILHRPRRDEAPLLDACATSRPAPVATAPHLSRRRDRDRPVGFADVAVLPDPEWARAGRNVSRYSIPGLVPVGQLAEVPLTAPDEDAIFIELAAARAKLLAPLHRRTDNLPALYEWSEHLSASRDTACAALAEEDRQRREDITAEAWVDEAAGAEMAACVADIAQTLAAQPGLAHEHAVLMALAPVVALLKGLVA